MKFYARQFGLLPAPQDNRLATEREKFLKNAYNAFTDKMLISIPEPENLKHLRETRPHILQVVDESIYDKDLSMFKIIEKIYHGIYIYYVLGKKS